MEGTTPTDKPKNQIQIMENAIEITKEAAHALIGNDEKSWHDYKQSELCEFTEYRAHGVRIRAVCNFLTGVTQYYVQDINA